MPSPAVDSDSGAVVLPRYGGGSLADLLPAVGTAMGVPIADPGVPVPALPSGRGWVVLLVDGLGWHLLREHREVAPYLASLLDDSEPLTTAIPSTTATSLTSLGTALPPGRHGIVGYTSRIPGTTRTLNALSWKGGPDPVEWQPYQTALSRLQQSGLDVTVVNKAKFEGSGLTLASQRGVPFLGADDPENRLVCIQEAVRTSRPLVYAYESVLDHTGHEHGCRSQRWRERLAVIDAEVAELRSALPNEIGLLVTGDHGMVDVPMTDRVELDDEPDLTADVVVLAGEARFRHVHTRATAVDSVAARWRDRLGATALVRTRDEAFDENWFGVVEDRVRPRIGDVLVASLGTSAVFSTSQFPVEHKMVGFHGSVTGAETLVPLLVDPPG
ncbi:MAG: Alkaline phosphodiesterase I / Nucleotide pyrophosphatase [uncultured Nocardioidaceae bacterium]|uniref:Alkaline phosphodiesterase I / Nucleotide pyrophosphatase n=1 Tax=uncultured Nocardioidaceae bacterium TaxID=253824 RepID=A0A6J4LSK0_9ACTN|nr:MAG: Alkaline phosphodiesterase I / Nucleotide pyrophosphatase [uncultured Nocardioidaceae bacterium]